MTNNVHFPAQFKQDIHVEWGERLHQTDAAFLSKIIWILFAFQMKDGHHDTKLFGLQSVSLIFIPAVVAFTLTLERLRLASAPPPSLAP